MLCYAELKEDKTFELTTREGVNLGVELQEETKKLSSNLASDDFCIDSSTKNIIMLSCTNMINC